MVSQHARITWLTNGNAAMVPVFPLVLAAPLFALVLLLAVTVPPLGRYIAAVFGSRPDGSAPGDRVFGPVERTIYRILAVDPKREQRWNVYAYSLLAFSAVSFGAVYLLQRVQGSRPLNPAGLGAVDVMAWMPHQPTTTAIARPSTPAPAASRPRALTR